MSDGYGRGSGFLPRHAASIVRTASSNEEAVRLIEEAMKEPP